NESTYRIRRNKGNPCLVIDILEPEKYRYFNVIINDLFFNHGIRVKEINNKEKPSQVLLTWNPDNSHIHPLRSYSQEARKNAFLTDYTMKIPGVDKKYPCHKLIIAAKAPHFWASQQG